MTHHVVAGRDGRGLGVTGHGEPLSTRVVVLCPTSPGSVDFDPDPVASVASGLRITAVERPGYGATPPWTGEPRLDQWTDDVGHYLRAIAQDAEESTGIDVEVAGAIGIGYGCFFAAALAAAHPSIVRRLVLVSPPEPPLHSDRRLDPALAAEGRIDPLSGLLDRRQSAIAAAEQPGAGADHVLLSDGRWGHRLRDLEVPTDLYVGDSRSDHAGGRWWQRHLASATSHRAFGTGVAMIAAVWASALDTFAPDD